jgi:hypothetical protein
VGIAGLPDAGNVYVCVCVHACAIASAAVSMNSFVSNVIIVS